MCEEVEEGEEKRMSVCVWGGRKEGGREGEVECV